MRISYFLGFFFLIAILLFVFLSYVSPLKKTTLLPFEQVTPEANLSFIPSAVFPNSNNSITSEIILSSNTPVKSAQIDLSYNPAIIYNMQITSSENNFFGDKNSYQVTLLEVRESIGRATFAIEKLPQVAGKIGEGPIATISFQTNPFVVKQATINFLNKSTVMGAGSRESVLKSITPLTILFKSMSTPTIQLNATPAALGN